MPVNWSEVQKSIFPIKNYEELCQRWQKAFAYPFVRKAYNYTMPQLAEYTRLGVGGDLRGRYSDYAAVLIDTLTTLHKAGVKDLLDLKQRTGDRSRLADFSGTSGIPATEIARVMKYLSYWFVPSKKQMSGLIRFDPEMSAAITHLSGMGISTNLDMLEAGLTPALRKALAVKSRLPAAVIEELVNRADFSRMPWASKATISNIIGAGYGSLAKLAGANPEKLFADFFRYGESIKKNLKLGNEIENSHRIAKIVPPVLQ